MRPWLVLKRAGAEFNETLIRLREQTSEATGDAAAAAGSPSRLVPVLKDGSLTIWDSLAICEYVADRFPEAGLWPDGVAARAVGRSAAAEMHSGFQALRRECPMDLSIRASVDLSEDARKDIRRVVAVWRGLLARFGGPFLVGRWSIADAFYTPVATRFRTYGVDLSDFGYDGAASAYAGRLLQTPEYLQWESEALADERVVNR
jgi:glutathione S-transferase